MEVSIFNLFTVWGSLRAHTIDLAEFAAVEAMVAFTVKQFGRSNRAYSR
jgi:hypothetical protein